MSSQRLVQVFLWRLLITLGILLAVSVLFEIYLRSTVAHIQGASLKRGGLLEHSPNLLIDYTSEGRRLLPSADVVIKNHYISGRDVPLTTNALGFRGEELSSVKQAGELRILALGDSITLADYLPAEETWTVQADSALQAALPDRKISVINAGVMDVSDRKSLPEIGEQVDQ